MVLLCYNFSFQRRFAYKSSYVCFHSNHNRARSLRSNPSYARHVIACCRLNLPLLHFRRKITPTLSIKRLCPERSFACELLHYKSWVKCVYRAANLSCIQLIAVCRLSWQYERMDPRREGMLEWNRIGQVGDRRRPKGFEHTMARHARTGL